jgi:hypothetical protein
MPGSVLCFGYVAYPATQGSIGEGFEVVSFTAIAISFILGLVSNFLYTHWNRKHSALYLQGMSAQLQECATFPKEDIHRVCRSGIENPGSAIGVYSHGKEDYTLLHAFFERVSLLYHCVDALPGPDEDHLHQFPKAAPAALADFPWASFATLRLRVSRNLEGFPFCPGMSSAHRRDVLNLLRRAILSYHAPNVCAQTPVRDSHDWIEVPMLDVPEIWPMREYEFMESAGILKDWPNFRSVFKKMYGSTESAIGYGTLRPARSQAQVELGVVVNEEDHLRFYAVVHDPDATSAMAAHDLLGGLVHHVQERVKFSFLPGFGYLGTCPSNSGTGYKISCRNRLGVTAASERRLGVGVADIVAECSKTFE